MHFKKILSASILASALIFCIPQAIYAAPDAKTETPVTYGWNSDALGRFFLTENGSRATGFCSIDQKVYYFDPDGYLFTPSQEGVMYLAQKPYYFLADGSVKTGLFSIKSESGISWYYAGANYQLFTNRTITLGGKIYCFGANGKSLPKGLQALNGKKYLISASGTAKTGRRKYKGKTYFFDSTGAMMIGKVTYKNKTYFTKANGTLAKKGWVTSNGKTYYLNSNGSMATGWVKVSGKWYYLKSNGAMVTGWQKINGYWYYFYKNKDSHGGIEGVMAANTKIDGYTLSASGAMKPTANSQMALKAQAYSSSTGYLILVNRATCQVGIFTGKTGFWNQIKSWSCSPGASSSPTVAGTFRVGGKGYYFDSGSARCYWYTQFYGNYLFHSVLYNKNGTLMDGRLGMHLSHGCVRLQIDNAKWIYNNIPRGTTVVVY